MENSPNNLRGRVAQLEGIELHRPKNLSRHLTKANRYPEIYTKYSKIND